MRQPDCDPSRRDFLATTATAFAAPTILSPPQPYRTAFIEPGHFVAKVATRAHPVVESLPLELHQMLVLE